MATGQGDPRDTVYRSAAPTKLAREVGIPGVKAKEAMYAAYTPQAGALRACGPCVRVIV